MIEILKHVGIDGWLYFGYVIGLCICIDMQKSEKADNFLFGWLYGLFGGLLIYFRSIAS